MNKHEHKPDTGKISTGADLLGGKHGGMGAPSLPGHAISAMPVFALFGSGGVDMQVTYAVYAVYVMSARPIVLCCLRSGGSVGVLWDGQGGFFASVSLRDPIWLRMLLTLNIFHAVASPRDSRVEAKTRTGQGRADRIRGTD